MLAGRVCKDPEMKFSQAGKGIFRFLMAIEGRDKTTMWITCAVFHEKTIEIFKDRIVKGTPVAVTGRLDPRAYEGKQYFDLAVDMFGLEVMEKPQQQQQGGYQQQPDPRQQPQQQGGGYQQQQPQQQPQQQYSSGNPAAAAGPDLDGIPF